MDAHVKELTGLVPVSSFYVSGNCSAVVLSVCRKALQTVLHDCMKKSGVAAFL